jgi:hypothetical protein
LKSGQGKERSAVGKKRKAKRQGQARAGPGGSEEMVFEAWYEARSRRCVGRPGGKGIEQFWLYCRAGFNYLSDALKVLFRLLL